MSFRPGGFESDDDDFIDFGECTPTAGLPPREGATSSLSTAAEGGLARPDRSEGDREPVRLGSKERSNGASSESSSPAFRHTSIFGPNSVGQSKPMARGLGRSERNGSRGRGRGCGKSGGGGGGGGTRGSELEQGEEVRIAVARGNHQEVKRILDAGFDPNTPLKAHWPAVMYACDAGDSAMIELLLDSGANPNTQSDHFTALMALCCSNCQNEEGLVKCARLLVNNGARINAHDRHHTTALIYAAQRGGCALVQILLDSNADVNQQDARGWTAVAYAAGKGNTRLCQVLMTAGANLELCTNLGDTPSSIAYSEGFTSLVDLLEGTAHSKPVPGRPQFGASLSLPPHPLLASNGSDSAGELCSRTADTSGTKSNSGDRGVAADPTRVPPPLSSSSASSTQHYGELELFLAGLDCRDALPLFAAHRVTFADLLSMTDGDLEKVGIGQVGVRRKILDSVASMHKQQWGMPKDAGLPVNRHISAAEASVILSHLATHATYIRSTATFLLGQAQSSPDLQDSSMDERESDRIAAELESAVAAVRSLSTEVDSIKTQFEENFGRPVGGEDPSQQSLGGGPSFGSRMFTGIRFIGALAIIGSGAFICYKAIRER